MRLDDFVLLLAKKYGRQNQDMHDSFDAIFCEMKKKINNKRERNFNPSGASNSSEERDLMHVMTSANIRRYEDLSDYQQKYYDKIVT